MKEEEDQIQEETQQVKEENKAFEIVFEKFEGPGSLDSSMVEFTENKEFQLKDKENLKEMNVITVKSEESDGEDPFEAFMAVC